MPPAMGAGNDPKAQFAALIDRLTRWIPGDTLAIYAPGVTALAAQKDAQPSIGFLVVAIILTPLFVLGGWWASNTNFSKGVMLKLVLGLVAFVIWSVSVPFSGWQRLDLVSDHQAATAIGAAILGILFGYAAEGAVRRWG
jgi:hypothetical protein